MFAICKVIVVEMAAVTIISMIVERKIQMRSYGSLNAQIHVHFIAKGDFNEIAKDFIDSKIAELLPKLNDKDVITLSYLGNSQSFDGYLLKSPAEEITISLKEISTWFKIEGEFTYERNSLGKQAQEALFRAYSSLPNRTNYFVRGSDLDQLIITTSM